MCNAANFCASNQCSCTSNRAYCLHAFSIKEIEYLTHDSTLHRSPNLSEVHFSCAAIRSLKRLSFNCNTVGSDIEVHFPLECASCNDVYRFRNCKSITNCHTRERIPIHTTTYPSLTTVDTLEITTITHFTLPVTTPVHMSTTKGRPTTPPSVHATTREPRVHSKYTQKTTPTITYSHPTTTTTTTTKTTTTFEITRTEFTTTQTITRMPNTSTNTIFYTLITDNLSLVMCLGIFACSFLCILYNLCRKYRRSCFEKCRDCTQFLSCTKCCNRRNDQARNRTDSPLIPNPYISNPFATHAQPPPMPSSSRPNIYATNASNLPHTSSRPHRRPPPPPFTPGNPFIDTHQRSEASYESADLEMSPLKSNADLIAEQNRRAKQNYRLGLADSNYSLFFGSQNSQIQSPTSPSTDISMQTTSTAFYDVPLNSNEESTC